MKRLLVGLMLTLSTVLISCASLGVGRSGAVPVFPAVAETDDGKFYLRFLSDDSVVEMSRLQMVELLEYLKEVRQYEQR